jgi:hypothetical protein
LSSIHQDLSFVFSIMPSNRKRRQATAACRKAATLAQMVQGNGLVFDVGMLRHTSDLTPENQAAIVSTVLVDKSAMFRICIVKLSDVICNVNISGDFGRWMIKNQTIDIQIPILVQQH